MTAPNVLPAKPPPQQALQPGKCPAASPHLGQAWVPTSHLPWQARAAHPCSGHARTPARTASQWPGEQGPGLTAGGAGFAQRVPVTQVCQHSHTPFQVSKELPLSPHGMFSCPQQRLNGTIPSHSPERLAWPGIIAKTPATSPLGTPRTPELQNRLQQPDHNQSWHYSSTAFLMHGQHHHQYRSSPSAPGGLCPLLLSPGWQSWREPDAPATEATFNSA